MRVSVIIPVLNDESYIVSFLKCLEEQDFDAEDIEYLFLDGSNDNTKYFIDTYSKLRHYSIVPNPYKTRAWAMKLGMDVAKGSIIIRMSTHGHFPRNYVSECVKALENHLGDMVGGYCITQGEGLLGGAIARVISSPFGSRNREPGSSVYSGLVDHVLLGCFYKDYIESIGGYNTELIHNEDKELNYRIRKAGGKVFLSNNLYFTLSCSNTLSDFCSNVINKGYYDISSVSGSVKLIDFMPFLFFLSVVCLGVISLFSFAFLLVFGLEIALYFALSMIFASRSAENFNEGLLMTFLFPLYHICYGFGSLKAIFKLK